MENIKPPDSWVQRLIDEEGASPPAEPFSLHESLQDLEAERSRFILDLRERFLCLAREFNQLKKTGHFIYIYKLPRFETGFMLYRRGFRLIFSPDKEGRIQIQALQTMLGRSPKEIFSASLAPFRLNPLSEFQWLLRGAKGFAQASALASFYFKAFARLSRPSLSAEASINRIDEEEAPPPSSPSAFL